MDWLDDLTNTEQFEQQGGESFTRREDLVTKELVHGDNKFRIVSRPKIYWVHRFQAANGTFVQSICTKDKDGNETSPCSVCARVKAAWKIYNDKDKSQYTREDIEEAEVMIGKRAAPNGKFEQSWSAKRMVSMNILDRDSTVNAEKAHTSLLCKTQYDLGITAAQKGIYEEIVKLLSRHREQIAAHGEEWLPFDIILSKAGKGKSTSYDKYQGDTYGLTEEELAYEQYNLDDLLQPTDMALVDKWLTVGTKGSLPQAEEGAEPVQNTVQHRPAAPAQAKPAAAKPTATAPKSDATTAKPTATSPKPTTAAPAAKAAPTQPKPVVAGKPAGLKPKAAPPPPPVETAPEATEEMAECPGNFDEGGNHIPCGKLIPVSSTKCPHCGVELEYEAEEGCPF